MDKVVSLSDFKESKSPHAEGSCKCLACGETWIGTFRVPLTTSLQCPKCLCYRGVPEFEFVPEGGVCFQCDCGCFYNVISKSGPLCLGCGVIHRWEEFT